MTDQAGRTEMTYKSLDSQTTRGGRLEVVEYGILAGSSDARTAEKLFFLRESGMKLKSVKITLNKGRARLEPGALYHMSGELEMVASTGGGIGSALKRKITTGESLLVNEVKGTGEIFLEPTYGHFILAELNDDEIIVDNEMFYAAIGDLNITSIMQRSLSAGFMGNDGWFQTKISGTGIVALFSPVPQFELQKIELNNSMVAVDGNFAIMRSGDIKFTVQKSSKSWLATSASGEGLLNFYKGTGTVWLAPTQGVYEKLSTPEGLDILSRATGSRGSHVNQKK
ncbi:MAG: AIM24 family protein [Roseibium sp.]|uniref:AIM24 family protein n=1 Tax=Roseibium sp. TaxID=1936156 RepID=UPI00329835B1